MGEDVRGGFLTLPYAFSIARLSMSSVSCICAFWILGPGLLALAQGSIYWPRVIGPWTSNPSP